MLRKAVAKKFPFLDSYIQSKIETPKSRSSERLFRGVLKVDNSAFEADGDGVGPIIGAQLGENVLDVALHVSSVMES
jgi:hypothetical protein